MRILIALALTLSGPSLLSGGEIPTLLGRCPLDSVTEIRAGRFVTADIDDLLVVQELGRAGLATAPAYIASPGRQQSSTRLCALALFRLAGTRFMKVWQSPPLLGSPSPESKLSANAWAVSDLNRDGRHELLLLTSDSCQVISFGADEETLRVTVGVGSRHLPGAWPVEAVCCDVDDDSVGELVTLELSPLEERPATRMLRVYEPTDSGFLPASTFLTAIDWGPETQVHLLGSVRFEDYPGELPVIAGIRSRPAPSVYAIVYPARPDAPNRVSRPARGAVGSPTEGRFDYSLVANPFPLQPWFSKSRVLPAGRLLLTNVGDTLVAFGYFVPGSRPEGPAQSFAALQDGEWRLLEITGPAARISSPLCRFVLDKNPGWLELRDNVFRFYPGEVFRWR